ncbi:hypothetical protein [Oceanobacillus halophilus]|uniref:Uncharacterized protein n=1 Tax=Oceanobacillus halophilus TaxID=930130 RepID=A0A495A290_9BACI|nr:hypothetical protein [Oceanobacillus halophilus]RKQ33039.1 hypothetical protein D8M06_11660 [Oceanobacillus halophilus]
MIQSLMKRFILVFVYYVNRKQEEAIFHFNMERIWTVGKERRLIFHEEERERTAIDETRTGRTTSIVKHECMLTSITVRGSPSAISYQLCIYKFNLSGCIY